MLTNAIQTINGADFTVTTVLNRAEMIYESLMSSSKQKRFTSSGSSFSDICCFHILNILQFWMACWTKQDISRPPTQNNWLQP